MVDPGRKELRSLVAVGPASSEVASIVSVVLTYVDAVHGSVVSELAVVVSSAISDPVAEPGSVAGCFVVPLLDVVSVTSVSGPVVCFDDGTSSVLDDSVRLVFSLPVVDNVEVGEIVLDGSDVTVPSIFVVTLSSFVVVSICIGVVVAA